MMHAIDAKPITAPHPDTCPRCGNRKTRLVSADAAVCSFCYRSLVNYVHAWVQKMAYGPFTAWLVREHANLGTSNMAGNLARWVLYDPCWPARRSLSEYRKHMELHRFPPAGLELFRLMARKFVKKTLR
jgi:hypothetical protein